MTETSVKDQLKKLVEVQKIDEQIYKFNQDLQEKPQIIENLKNEFEETKTHLNALEEKLKHIQVDRKEKELELKAKEDEIAKANTVLSELKTNKEYSAKISEIESIKADKSQIEEKILISFDEADAVNQDIEKEKAVLAEREKEYLAKKQVVEGEIKEIETQVTGLKTGREEAARDIDPTMKARYEKILERREGLAIVPVIGGNSCGGCHMNVTPQMVNAIKMNTELVPCEYCQRILYLEEDLG